MRDYTKKIHIPFVWKDMNVVNYKMLYSIINISTLCDICILEICLHQEELVVML